MVDADLTFHDDVEKVAYRIDKNLDDTSPPAYDKKHRYDEAA